MIKTHLPVLLAQKRWKQADLARKTGIRPNTVSEIYHGFADGISFERLDALCKVFDCSISDIFEYVPDSHTSQREVVRRKYYT